MKPTVETKICELVKRGHLLSSEVSDENTEILRSSVAAMLSDLASQLEVQLVRSNALAAKLSMINGLMDAAEQANKLAQEATEKLVQERDALAAENAGLKAISVKLYNYGYLNGHHHTVEGYFTDIHRSDIDNYHSDIVEEIIDEEPPATDAFLAEVRAHDINAFIQHHSAELDAHIKNGGEQFDEKSVRIRNIIVSARLFREQIRKGVQS